MVIASVKQSIKCYAHWWWWRKKLAASLDLILIFWLRFFFSDAEKSSLTNFLAYFRIVLFEWFLWSTKMKIVQWVRGQALGLNWINFVCLFGLIVNGRPSIKIENRQKQILWTQILRSRRTFTFVTESNGHFIIKLHGNSSFVW